MRSPRHRSRTRRTCRSPDRLMICFCGCSSGRRPVRGLRVVRLARRRQRRQCYSCGRRNPGLWGFGPMLRAFGNDLGFVTLVVYGCSALYVSACVADRRSSAATSWIGGNPLSMLSPSPASSWLFGASGADPVFGYGRWWTVLSAGWLHGGALHILFNMMWVRQLGPATADIYGPAGWSSSTRSPASSASSAAPRRVYPVVMPMPFLRGARLTSARRRRSSACSAR